MDEPRARELLAERLEPFGKDLATARISDYRKLYHAGWSELLEELVEPDDRRWTTDRFRLLVF